MSSRGPVGNSVIKPNMLFFRQTSVQKLQLYIVNLYANLELQCLQHYFNVTVIDYDCDYNNVCDKFEPEICFFELGTEMPVSLKIDNIKNNNSVPKLGFIKTDFYAGCRTKFLHERDQYGIDDFFCWQPPIEEYLPLEFTNKILYWPFFVDIDRYSKFQNEKTIPISLFGIAEKLEGNYNYYPWREMVKNQISAAFPLLTVPHPRLETTKMVVRDNDYISMINSSKFSITCGGFVNGIVAKHLEIPAARACLVTEQNRTVERFGFKDMINCIIANPEDIVEKVSLVMEDNKLRERITEAGFELVKTKHSILARDQIKQWFELNKVRRGTDQIVQSEDFLKLEVKKNDVFSSLKKLTIGRKKSYSASSHIYEGKDRQYLCDGDAFFKRAEYIPAREEYSNYLKFAPYIPEHFLRICLCDLAEGNNEHVIYHLSRAINLQKDAYGSDRMDPSEALILLLALFLGDQIQNLNTYFSGWKVVSSPYLRSLMKLISKFAFDANLDLIEEYNCSIHELPFENIRSFKQYVLKLSELNFDNEQTSIAIWAAELDLS